MINSSFTLGIHSINSFSILVKKLITVTENEKTAHKILSGIKLGQIKRVTVRVFNRDKTGIGIFKDQTVGSSHRHKILRERWDGRHGRQRNFRLIQSNGICRKSRQVPHYGFDHETILTRLKLPGLLMLGSLNGIAKNIIRIRCSLIRQELNRKNIPDR